MERAEDDFFNDDFDLLFNDDDDEEENKNRPVEVSSGNKKKNKKNKNYQREVIKTSGNGFQTIEIRQVHVGQPAFSMPLMSGPTIIVGKLNKKNLKDRPDHAPPFKIIQGNYSLILIIYRN